MFRLERRGRFTNWHAKAEPSSSSESGIAAWLSPSVTRNPLLFGGVAALQLEGLRRAAPPAGAAERLDPTPEAERPSPRNSSRSARFVGRLGKRRSR
jgi:hypothetical protein